MSLTDPVRKIALVTGANKGLGFEIALKLSQKNFKVIMADKDNQTQSKDKIICQSNNDDIHTYNLDLACFESVKNFVKQFSSDLNKLDVLINNAGIFCMKKKKTVDCLDGVMQVNHLSSFLLTTLLEDKLKASGNSRIVFITSNGSMAHRMSVEKLKTPDYFTPHFISGAIHYYNTKLCNMISSKGFSEKLKDFNVTSNCVHPDMMNTTFLTANHCGDTGFFAKIEYSVAKCIVQSVTKDVKQCVDGVCFLATSDRIKNVTGKYFYNYQLHSEPKILENEQFCNDIWNETEKLIGLK
ncbi:retinol dehydrogenase 13-like [Diorhabda carinulata]|uniref:retinol dehydrogenase 13-like n=1 Tax=Diorhabda carinulata TaxID=1163345 RepID=UPI0025A1E899|nr:retinol dehydrogenase 13-like [Diorhabda carinulata]